MSIVKIPKNSLRKKEPTYENLMSEIRHLNNEVDNFKKEVRRREKFIRFIHKEYQTQIKKLKHRSSNEDAINDINNKMYGG